MSSARDAIDVRGKSGRSASPFGRLVALRAVLSDGDRRAARIETLVVTLAAILLAWLSRPRDPFLLEAGFPWLMLAPLFVALRHGFAYGFSSAMLLVVLIAGGWRYGWGGIGEFPTATVFGMLVTTMVAGEFSDLWQRKLARVELEHERRETRLEEFTRSYHLLKISHDQLVERLAGASVSLRQAVNGLYAEMLETRERGDPLVAHAGAVLGLFRRYAAVQSASLHRADADGKLDPRPLARLGAPPENDEALASRAIVKEALETGEMMSVLATDSGAPRYVEGDILAVAPIRDVTGKTWAALVIYRLPFLKFNDENLRLISVMAAALGDLLHNMEAGSGEGDEEPRQRFLRELEQAARHARRFGIQSRLVAIELRAPGLAIELTNQRRSLDSVWLRHLDEHGAAIFWLMPFTDDYGVAGFKARLELWAGERAGPDGASPLRFHAFSVNGDERAGAMVARMEAACGLAGA